MGMGPCIKLRTVGTTARIKTASRADDDLQGPKHRWGLDVLNAFTNGCRFHSWY